MNRFAGRNLSRLAEAILLLLVFLPLSAPLANSLDRFNDYDSAGLLYLDEAGRVIKTRRAEDLLVPASTTKLVTAWLGLNHWGEEYRFKTDFYLDESGKTPLLWIKGYGDPFLVSEELLLIAPGDCRPFKNKRYIQTSRHSPGYKLLRQQRQTAGNGREQQSIRCDSGCIGG